MMTREEIEQAVVEMEDAFDEIQQPRTPFVLQHFVVGEHDATPQQYAQCVLEMQIAYDNIRLADINAQKIGLEIAQFEVQDTPLCKLEIQEKRIHLEQQDRARLGALREFSALYVIWKSFGRTYTRGELDAGQEEYWVKRLTRQAMQGLNATGRISVGDQDALRMIGRTVLPALSESDQVQGRYLQDTNPLLPRQSSAEASLSNEDISGVQQRYLAEGDIKIIIAVPTKEKATEGLQCIKGLETPGHTQIKIFNAWGKSVADNYNEAAMLAVSDGATYMLCVEDDTFPPTDALLKLLDSGMDIIGAWYPKKTDVREGAPIELVDGVRRPMVQDGTIREAYTLTQGCTLIKVDVFKHMPYPWFVTTKHLTQDSFFSQRARDAGYKLWCDTAIICRHIDRETGREHS